MKFCEKKFPDSKIKNDYVDSNFEKKNKFS